MIVDEIRRNYTLRADQMFTWEAGVFIKSGTVLADFIVKSHRAFSTQKTAVSNCTAVLNILCLKQKGRALARPSSTTTDPKSELSRVRRRRNGNGSSGSSRRSSNRSRSGSR